MKHRPVTEIQAAIKLCTDRLVHDHGVVDHTSFELEKARKTFQSTLSQLFALNSELNAANRAT